MRVGYHVGLAGRLEIQTIDVSRIHKFTYYLTSTYLKRLTVQLLFFLVEVWLSGTIEVLSIDWVPVNTPLCIMRLRVSFKISNCHPIELTCLSLRIIDWGPSEIKHIAY